MDALTTNEQRELAECEAVIEAGQKTFVEVGEALTRIRDKRLYRATHKSFDLYCQDMWNWTRQRANQLIDAAEVVNQLPNESRVLSTTVVKNEAQARALKPVPVEERPNVLDKAAQLGRGKATAGSIKEARRVLAEPVRSEPKQDAPRGRDAPSSRRERTGRMVSESEAAKAKTAFGVVRRVIALAGLETPDVAHALDVIAKCVKEM